MDKGIQNSFDMYVQGGTSDNGKHYLTIQQLASYIGLSRWSIYKLVKERRIPYIPHSKRTFRFDRFSIDKWMAKKEVKTLADHIL